MPKAPSSVPPSGTSRPGTAPGDCSLAPTREDAPALARLGATVRARLQADPAVWQAATPELDLFVVADFLDTDECRQLMALVDAVARPSQTYGGHGIDPAADPARTSFSGDVDPADPFIRSLQRRFDDLLGLPGSFGETIQGQRYLPGQQFKPHFDHFLDTNPMWPEIRQRGGQRSWTAMAYLNRVEAGGETAFPEFGISIPPQPGALLVWNNMDSDGLPNPRSLHAGEPVLAGTKYVITKWYRCRPIASAG